MTKILAVHRIALVVLAFIVGCVSMSKLEPLPRADLVKTAKMSLRDICQHYADDSAAFIGQQEALGVGFGTAAVAAGGIGLGVSNRESGNAWRQNRKTFFLTGAAV